VDAETRLDVAGYIFLKMKARSNFPHNLFLYILFLSGIGWLIYTYQVLIGPLIVSGLIAYLLYPGVSWLSKITRIKQRQLVPVVYSIFLLLVVLVVLYIVPIIAYQFSLLTSQLNMILYQAEIFLTNLENKFGFRIPLEPFISDLETEMSQLLKPERIFRILKEVTTNFVWVVIVVITSFHLLRDWERLQEWLIKLSPKDLESDLRYLHQEIKKVWQSYLGGQLLIMLILGVLSGIGIALIGVPGALILGFLAGVLALIPTLGPATATGIAALVAWIQGSSHFDLPNLVVALITVAIFQAIQLFEGFWLTPRVMSRRLNLHPGLVLIAIVGTLFTLGALMALIIIPIIGSLDLIFRYIGRKRAGLDPWSSQESYQVPDLTETVE
jgi:predicted PurR-regulated permease PerM